MSSHPADRPEKRSIGGVLVKVGLGSGLIATLLFGVGSRPEGDPDTDGRAAWGAQTAFAAQAADGKKVYNTTCAACHQASGEGVAGTFPPLVESEWVTGSKGRLIRIILHGMSGPVTVGGEEYNSMMPPWKSLSDAEIAAVATYIRTSWGNKASAVTAAEVKSVREATAARTKPWTAKELVAATTTEK